ncbi:metallophosphoesterase family protein [Pseudoxanthomonas beigongshangi]
MPRIAVVSDIHGNLAALEAVAADIHARGIACVVNLGDNLSGPLLPRETARFLMDSGWLSLAGNHERQILELLRDGRGGESDHYAAAQLGTAERDWLRSLEPCVRMDDELLLCHGTPRSDCEHLLETVVGPGTRMASADEIARRLAGETAPVIACGHSHVPRAIRTPAGQLLINPGSVGLQAYRDDHPVPYMVENGSPDARYAILEKGAQGWQVEHVALPYDHAAMARLARERGRPEWERALLGGYATA